jgi:hypothetical protein
MSTLVHNLLSTKIRNSLLMVKQSPAVYMNAASIKCVEWTINSEF